MAFRLPFFSKTRTATPPTVVSDQPSTPPPINEELFVDREEHVTSPAGPVAGASAQLSIEDLTERGFHDGYTYRDPTARQNALEAIKARIRGAIDRDLAAVVQHMNRVDLHIQQLEGAGMDTSLLALKATRTSLERQAMDLGEALLQATGGCGPAEFPCATYTNGFNRGYTAYLNAELLSNTYLAR